jgi:RNA polymerase sigma-54 factor
MFDLRADSHLRISNLYKDIIASGNTQSSEVKDYIRDKIRSGKFLIRSIHRRQQTIFNIGQQIVSRQRDFLEHGPSHLKHNDDGRSCRCRGDA